MNEPKRMRIFLVDDERFCLSLYEQKLRALGYDDIHCFQDAFSCLNHLYLDPDVIFLDYHLGTTDGLWLLRKIKRHNPDNHVVFLSGQESIEIAVNSLKNGAFDYVVKESVEGKEDKLENVLNRIQAFNQVSRTAPPKESLLKRWLF